MTIASRHRDSVKLNVPPSGEWAGAEPKTTVPTTSAQAGSRMLAAKLSPSATTNFCHSSRARGTGIASRYRSEAQLASLATVSPQNSATMTTSRNPTAANSVNRAKFAPPVVARLTSSGAASRPLPPLPPPSLNAAAIRMGRASSTSNANWVRRRLTWRTSSTRSFNVRPGSNSTGAGWPQCRQALVHASPGRR